MNIIDGQLPSQIQVTYKGKFGSSTASSLKSESYNTYIVM